MKSITIKEKQLRNSPHTYVFFSSFYTIFYYIFLCRVDWGPVKNKSESGKSTR